MIFIVPFLLAIATCVGCWTPRPYSSDPLVTHRRATVGDFEKAGCVIQHVEPQVPEWSSKNEPVE